MLHPSGAEILCISLLLLLSDAIVTFCSWFRFQVHSAIEIDVVLDLLASKYFKYIDIRYEHTLLLSCFNVVQFTRQSCSLHSGRAYGGLLMA